MRKILLFISISLVFVACGSKSGPNKEKITPIAVAPTQESKIRPVYNIYIENSGSMYGFVKGITEFEQAVYSYLSDIKISGLTDTLNLNYINSKIINQGSDISNFIEKLEPTTFKIKGGNMTTSDISDNLKMILNRTNENIVSIYVSDCIFSPGSGKDAQEYLVNQQIGFKVIFANYIKGKDIAVMIYQLSSKFDGLYYNKDNQPTRIAANRPFYIWVIGKKGYISQLRDKVKQESFKGSGVQNSYTIFEGNSKVEYGVLLSPKCGEFDPDHSDRKTHILNIKKESHGINSGKFMFSVGVDLSNLPLDKSYIANSSNYEISDKDYTIEIIPNSNSQSNPYTHILKLSTSVIKKSDMTIKLKNIMPTWVANMNDSIGLNIHADEAMNKTFGIKYLIGGVYEAFTAKDSQCYFEIKLRVN